MTTHTPGPWEYGKDKTGTKRVFAGGWEIVRAMSRNGTRTVPLPERDANARLIAAAPELLEACEAMIAHRKAEYLDCDVKPYAAVRSAIAKARGS